MSAQRIIFNNVLILSEHMYDSISINKNIIPQKTRQRNYTYTEMVGMQKIWQWYEVSMRSLGNALPSVGAGKRNRDTL